jgi:hypothetical protein
VAFSIKRKSSSINEYGDDEWATPSKENKKWMIGYYLQ